MKGYKIMSRYTSFHGFGCVLSVTEFEEFLKKYIEKHPEYKFNEKKLDGFQRSNGKRKFNFEEMPADKANKTHLLSISNKECILPAEKQYVVFSDLPLEDPQYQSIEDVLKEFKGKLKDYLPDDFSWENKIYEKPQVSELCLYLRRNYPNSL